MILYRLPAAGMLTIGALVLCSQGAHADAGIAVLDATVQAGRKATTMPFVIQRSGDTDFAVDVTYATQDGSAVAGRDYTASSGIVTIPAGQTTVTVNVPVARKLLDTGRSKTFTLALSAAKPSSSVTFANAAMVPVDRYSAGIATADFNADGKPDAVVASMVTGYTYVLRNDTPAGGTVGSFGIGAAIAPLLTGPASVGVADLNRDGKPDIVVTSMDTNRLTVLINTTPAGASTFSFVASVLQLPDFGWANDVSFADFDGDGIVDMVLSNPGSTVSAGTDRVLVYANKTAAGATVPVLSLVAAPTSGPQGSGIGATGVRALDVNGDGKPDIAVGGFGSSRVGVLLNTTTSGATTPTFSDAATFPTADGVTSLQVADFNGDGRPDIVTANGGTSQLGSTWTVMLNTTPVGGATPSFAVADQHAGAPTVVAAADLDGDGTPDVLVADALIDSNANGGITAYLNRTVKGSSTPTFVAAGTYPAGDEPRSLATADFNRDGRPDIITNDSVDSLANIAFLKAPVANNKKAVIVDGSATGSITRPPKP